MKKKVLIVEPSKSFAQFIKYILSRLGYEVFHIENANQAFETINGIMPDMIIAEAAMKEVNGIDLCRRMKGEKIISRIPVAIISIDGTMETRQEAHKAGCVDYMAKPVTARAVHELMERHLPFHHKRHNIRVKMNIKVKVYEDTKSEEMKALTIGEGGLYVCTLQPYKVGTKLNVSLPLPSFKSPLELKGEVIYITDDNMQEIPKGMGMKFLGMDNNTISLLRHYMESYLSDYLPESFSTE